MFHMHIHERLDHHDITVTSLKVVLNAITHERLSVPGSGEIYT